MRNLIIDGNNHGPIAGYHQIDAYGNVMWEFKLEDGRTVDVWAQDIRNWDPCGGDSHNDYEISTYYKYVGHIDGYRYRVVFRYDRYRVLRTKNDRTTYGKRYSMEGFECPADAYIAIQKNELTFPA